MVESIVLSGVAIGCIYALIGITYNVMFSASRVFSFTAGTLGMLGGILGSLFILRMGIPMMLGLVLALLGGALLGVVTEVVAVRPVLKSLDQHLYVLSTLAGFAGGQMLLAFFDNAPLLTFYGFVPVALGGMGNNRGAVVAGLILGLFQQAANFLVGGIFASVAVFAAFIFVLLAFPDGLAGASTQRRV